MTSASPSSRSSVELARAIDSGELERARHLLEQGVDVEASGVSHLPSFGFFMESPLVRAVSYSDLAMIQLLIDHGADVDSVDGDGWSALTFADAAGEDEVIELLLALGADPSLAGRHGYSTAHRAARRGETGERLLNLGEESFDAVDATGATPLALAVRFGHLATAGELLTAGANPDAVSFDEHGHVWAILAEAANRDAADNDGSSFVRLLLDAGADPNPPGTPPLFQCITHEGDGISTMHLLLTAGADPSAINPADQDTLVHRALQMGSDDVIGLVLSLGLSLELPDGRGRNPLLAAVHQENPHAIRRLLAAGADRTAQDGDGRTAEALALHSSRAEELLDALNGTSAADLGPSAPIP